MRRSDRIGVLTSGLVLALAALVHHREVLAERPWLALAIIPLALLVMALARRLPGAGQDEPEGVLARLRGGSLVLFALSLAVPTLMFADVVFGERTMISAPWFNLEGEALDPAAGFEHLIDPFAGFYIEGPSIYLTGAAFAKGELPLWNPFEGCGTPFAANGETAVFSLLQLPLHLAPSLRAWDYFALLRIALAIYLAGLATRSLGASWRSSAFVGTCWGASGVFVLFANLVHLNAAVFLPLILIAFEAVRERPTARRTAFLAIALALGLNGGNPQPVFALLTLLIPRAISPLFSAPERRRGLAFLGCAASAFGLAALCNAPGLLSMAELLGRSANRTHFDLSGPNETADFLAFASPPFPIGRETYGIIHPPRFWFVGVLAFTLILAAMAQALVKGAGRPRTLTLGLLLFVLLLTTGLAEVFSKIPVIGGLKWGKYVAAPQLLGLVLAGPFLDRLLRKQDGAPSYLLGAALLVLAAAVIKLLSGSAMFASLIAIIVLIPALALLSFARRISEQLATPILIAVIELGIHLPSHPPRPKEPLERLPSGLASLAQEVESASPIAMNERQAAFADAVPPMLSGLLGWHDFRSVTPLPPLAYHRFMSPWVNCGPWPPYLLLGASREIMLSPAFDHIGVRWLLVRENDFRAVVRSARSDLLEDEPVIRFGELQRSLKFGSIESDGLLNLYPYEGACLIAAGEPLRATLDLAAASARIGFKIESPAKGEFSARLQFAGQDFVLDQASPEVRVEISDAREPIDLRLEVAATEPVQLIFTHWWVSRHITKGRFDFDDRSTPEMEALGMKLLENRYPLRVARKVMQARYIAEPEEFWAIHRAFAADGSGWKPREETFIEGPDLEFSPETADLEESVDLSRQGFNRMLLDTRLRRSGLVFVAVTHDPGWHAFRNGREIPIYRADGTFMAVPQEAGEQRIEFVYEPPGFALGLWLSAGAILFLVILLLIGPRATSDRDLTAL